MAFQSAFSPLVTDEEYSDRLIQELYRIITVFFFAGAVLVFYNAFNGSPKTAVIAGSNAMVFGLLFFLIRRKRLRTACGLLMLLLHVTAIYACYTGQGLHDIGIVIYPLAMMVSSMLLSRLYFWSTVAFLVASALFTGWSELTGRLTHSFAGATTWSQVINLMVLLVTSAAMFRLLVESLLHAFRKAQENERNYRSIYNAAGEGIFIQDYDTGRILDVNPAVERMYGLPKTSPGEEFEKTICSHPDFGIEKARSYLQEARERGESRFEWLTQTVDGREFWVEVSLRKAEIGGRQRILAIVRDIDERKRLEDQIRHDDKMRAIGQLAGGVAHDFNNQLAGITGFAELIQDAVRPDSLIASYAQSIQKAAENSSSLTQKLLAFGRKGKFQVVSISLNETIRTVQGMLERSIPKDILIEISIPDEELIVMGDPSMLQNALLNLCLNARDAMPEGGHLGIHLEKLQTLSPEGLQHETLALPKGPLARVTVTDTGKGIPLELQKRVFEPFFTTKEKGKGTGLGLAAVYGTMQSHKGCMDFHSSSEGSTFSLLFPLNGPKNLGALPVSASESALEAGEAPIRGTILVAEDEDLVRTMIHETLSQAGYKVKAVSDGEKAWELAQRNSDAYCLALVDMVMPGMDGPRLFAELKKARPELPVLLLSGYSLNGQIQTLLDQGAAGFLQKPFSLKKLLALVSSILKQGSVQSIAT